MNERKILLFILSVVIYFLYSVHSWFTKDTTIVENTDNLESVVQKVQTEIEIIQENKTEVIKEEIKAKVIPLFIKNACSVLQVFTEKPPGKCKNKPEDMETDANAVTVIGITIFLIVLVLNAILDVIKVKEEERQRRKLNPDGERRQSLAEFANKKPLRRESSKFGLQLFQISEGMTSKDEGKKSRRQPKYTRGDSTNSYLSDRKVQTEGSAPASIGDTSEPKLVKRQSVAKLFDNKLRWLPQRPVYNYHHCEFRFWRNSTLKTIPYSLWYHMFRDQQTRSLNIGCLTIPKYQHISPNTRCRLMITQNSRQYHFDVECPTQHESILHSNHASPASLFEICRRVLYQHLSETAKRLSQETYSIYSDYNSNNNMNNLEDHFQDINIDKQNTINCDLNGNSFEPIYPENLYGNNISKTRKKNYHTPSDIMEEYFKYLPVFIKEDFRNGPVSRCENVNCKKPVFDYAYYEFCFGKIILIDNREDVILSAVFCSKSCAETWKKSKPVLSWSLMER
ncbi:uncharacterized protein LOC126371916 [Pectinophora gossypiella]|uniref:uncharacterized protein LOC126371916 n=1 Tax=Pectinophora gossypiella TaxID=13191 RepID=UPI00214F0F87|nr:uncharacterized protein LOC126371916 [Pectinophora gossypiella]